MGARQRELGIRFAQHIRHDIDVDADAIGAERDAFDVNDDVTHVTRARGVVRGAHGDVGGDVRVGVGCRRADDGVGAGEIWLVFIRRRRVFDRRHGRIARSARTAGAHDERRAIRGERGDGICDDDDVARGVGDAFVPRDVVLEHRADGGGGVLSGDVFPVRCARGASGDECGDVAGWTGVRGVRSRRGRGVERGVRRRFERRRFERRRVGGVMCVAVVSESIIT